MPNHSDIQIIEKIKQSNLEDYENLYQLYQMMLIIYEADNDDLEYCLKISKFIKEFAPYVHEKTFDERFEELYYSALLFEAQHHIFESYMIYLEKDREPEERFYLPRRRQLRKLGIIDALQDFVDGKTEILSLSVAPGTGKTTLEFFLITAWIGWYPNLCNLFSSHSGHVTRMAYDAVQNIVTNPEYRWGAIFPRVQIENVSAKEQFINVGKFKNFKSITFRAIGASQTGTTRADGILFCDDLCSGIEEALSKIRLDTLWTKYSTDLKTRKKMGRNGRRAQELHIATRWSVWDVIGRIKTIYDGTDKAKFISIPDIDPETGESNFDYDYGVGYDVAYFEDIAKSLDDITYKCLYKSEPIEREGILYNPDMLRRYVGNILPGKEPDAIIAICDTKDMGKDYNALGVFYQYGQDYYLHDVVFKNIDPYVLDDLNADCLVRNNVQIAEFESNKEGSRTADEVQKKVREKGGRCVITKKFTTQNKETKIIVNAPWVVQHVLFKDPQDYEVNSDYGQFMSWLCSYSQLGKNPHDDAPDMVAMLAVHENVGSVRTVIIDSPMR